ncbi:MAG: 2OG-Fe(II) oxygenase [Alphaproteobacteria bacterium]|nr:2OG-Fe(II) oxygenase [Alphaproteobacteria bacterium]
MARLLPGDPIAHFAASTDASTGFQIDTAAGRTLAFCEPGDLRDPAVRAMLCLLRARTDVFDGAHAAVFVLVRDLAEVDPNLRTREPGYHLFLDPDGSIAECLGLDWPGTLLVDRRLRALTTMDLDSPVAHAERVVEYVAALPRRGVEHTATATAPVLCVPRVLEPELCRALMAHYEAYGGQDSGFMRDDASGHTVTRLDHRFKRRRDCLIRDRALRDAVRERIGRRLVPEIRRAFAFDATRIERYLIARYDATEGGYFKPHRDNTTRGTAHRRFAATLMLNAEDHDGGDLRFPEYDDRLYRVGSGGALVFSCSILHEVTPVTRGRRFCVIPFLYDATAAQQRADNADSLVDGDLQAIALAGR